MMIPRGKKFTIVCPSSYSGGTSNKIAVIKAIRCLTGIGLKDAKDASERPYDQIFTLLTQTRQEAEEQFQILRENKVRVGTPAFMILEDLQALSIQALENGEKELANEITQLIVAERLRRES